jgi:hypothetical protein
MYIRFRERLGQITAPIETATLGFSPTISLGLTAVPSLGKPKIDYDKARKLNEFYLMEPTVRYQRPLGWGNKLATVEGGKYRALADLWRKGKYNEFADAVAQLQVGLGFPSEDVRGGLDLKTWGRIAGIGESMAGIVDIKWKPGAKKLCTEATRQRMVGGYKIATGKKIRLPANRSWRTFNSILQSIPERMMSLPLGYRGTGAAGALVYAGLGKFVSEADIWAGCLKPGAAIQMWRRQKYWEALRRGHKPRLIGRDEYTGTSYIFVRYHPLDPSRLLVRHFDRTEWVDRGRKKWIAANPKNGG